MKHALPSPELPAAKRPRQDVPGLPTPPPVLASGADGWTRVEKRKAKKATKVSAAAAAHPPAFAYAASELRARKSAVSISEARDLALHVVADGAPSPWARLANKGSVAGCVVLLVPGLTHTVLGMAPPPTNPTENPHLPVPIPLEMPATTGEGREADAARLGGLPFVRKTFSHGLPTVAPGDATRMHSVLSELLSAPVSGEEKRRRALARIAGERAQLDPSPEQYLLSVRDMADNGYPLPRTLSDTHQPPDPDEWVESTAEGAGDGEADVYAIDCEMCLTAAGKELARVSVVKGADVVYDTHVRPRAPITDYLTRFSGITPESLEGCTTTLADVQKRLLELLAPTPAQRAPILLGHSLESDLSALKLRHARVIDTALLYDHPRGRPSKPGLAWLTRKWCGREIQARGAGGHDPEEDARACAELLRRKLENGPGFGTFKTDAEPIFERIARARGGALRTATVDRNPSQGFGARASTAIAAAGDAEVAAGVLEALATGHGFVFARLTELADALGWVTPKASPDAPAPPAEPAPGPPPLDAALRNLDERLAAIHKALPARTALIVLSGHSDPREMSRLSAQRIAFEAHQRAATAAAVPASAGLPPRPANPFTVGAQPGTAFVGDPAAKEGAAVVPSWTSADARALEEAVAKARRGLLFLGFKN